MKRNLWRMFISEQKVPPWPCPICSKGTYSVVQNSFIAKETIRSQKMKNASKWNPEDVEIVFTAWLKCGNCGQEATVCGTGGIEDDWDDENNRIKWVKYYSPQYCYPMPDIIEMSGSWPEPIKKELRSSFSHFWADRPAAANRLRVAIERLMDHFKIKKRYRDGKDRKYSLHKRIEFFSKQYPNIGELLLSIKWFGNTASHDNDISIDELLDAYEIFEHVLCESLDKRSAILKTKAKNLTKKHSKI